MSSDLTILALDCSSTAIGVILMRDTRVQLQVTWHLSGAIGARCLTAREMVRNQLTIIGDVDLVVIESPVLRRFKRNGKRIDTAQACIQQSRVQGSVLGAVAEAGMLWLEITPAVAKQVVTGKGNASKADVFQAASLHFFPQSEHEADAYALALAASRMKITKEATA